MQIKIIMISICSLTLLCCNKAENEKDGVRDIDGNKYTTVTIGTQIWMRENLRVTRYRNGDSIPHLINNDDWKNTRMGAYCNYGNDPLNRNPYGHYYNWHCVDDSRQLAPVGWHIPSKSEWETLVNFLGGPNIAGGKLKEIGTQHWSDPNVADNVSGFTGLPGGNRSNLFGTYGAMGVIGYYWSSTENDAYTFSSWHCDMFNSTTDIRIDNSPKGNGFSVRCIKD